MRNDERTLDRRALLGLAAGVSAAATLGARASTADAAYPRLLMPKGRIGIQLYTVRDQVASLGFAEVFRRLAAMGYKEIEFAGYTQGSVGPISVAEIRGLLDANGLVGVGSHVSLSSFANNLEQVLDDAETLGLPFIGTANAPSSQNTVAAYQAAAENFNIYGQAAAARGMRFYQHNHDGEFGFAVDQPTVRLYDVLLAETDPALVFLEMDIFWAYVGQYKYGRVPPFTFEPLDYVTAQRHRYPLFHIKDGASNPASPNGYDMVDVGEGDIDFRGFLSAVGEKWRHHYIMERDNASQAEGGSFGSAARSYRAMRRMRAL